MSKMKCKRLCVMLTLSLLLVCMMGTTAFAAGTGDVAGAVESTWATASTQIKTVVNNVVFPAIDLILAVFFFAKLQSVQRLAVDDPEPQRRTGGYPAPSLFGSAGDEGDFQPQLPQWC